MAAIDSGRVLSVYLLNSITANPQLCLKIILLLLWQTFTQCRQ